MRKPIWQYSGKLGGIFNPLCIDVGDIERIKHEGATPGQDWSSLLTTISRKKYGTSFNPKCVAATGVADFQLINGKHGVLDKVYFDGDTVCMDGVSWFGPWENPCTNDPRIIYLYLWRLWKIRNNKPETKTRIPEREEARAWLESVGIPLKLFYFGAYLPKISRRLYEAFPGWYSEDMIMTPREQQAREEE